jgi:heavy metal translocating P-type ATPase
VKQGDYIPVDGKVVGGSAYIDRAAITGESMPIEVKDGDFVTGADIVKSGYLQVVAEKVGSDTTLSQIVKMVKEAGASKAPIQKIADKIAGVFVPVVTLIALVVFSVWIFIAKDISVAANYAISVLVISCPCSLGLATPVAIMAATGRGMALGILFKDAETLQKAKDIDCVLLDKTATLTVGIPKVTEFESFEIEKEYYLQVAAAIESQSNHPIAECIKSYAMEHAPIEILSVENYLYETGKGATAVICGRKYRLGSRKILALNNQQQADEIEKKYSKEGKTVDFLAEEQTLKAVFALADTLKDSSEKAIAELKEKNIRTAMVTGDIENVAKSIAEKVGIDECFAETLPQDKAKVVERARLSGEFVAMVGDGINDSPALKTADVGVAMGTGTDIAIDSADVVLVAGDLRSVSTMIDLSKETVKNIKQNLFWAFFYNCIAIPVAGGAFAFAGLQLNPMIAAACMSLSSLFVVTNALRLTRFKRKENQNNKENTDMVKTIKVEGMMCQHCVAHVTKALQGVDGVSAVEVNLKKKTATVTSEMEIDDGVLTAAITNAGYEVKKIS